MTAGSRQWLLISVLDRTDCSVVAAGFKSQKNSPLVSFLRARADRSAALGVVGDVEESCASSMRSVSGGRVAYAEPVAGPDGVVHAAWLLVGAAESVGPERPSAWAFTWNLDEGTASRGPMDEAADRPSVRSIAEALEEIDLNASMAEVANTVVSGKSGETYRAEAVRRMKSGPDRLVRFHAKLCAEDGARLIRGFSHDVGPIPEPIKPSSIGDIVATASSNPSQWRALVNLQNLELICWYGEAPAGIAWRYDAKLRELRIHEDDAARAAAMAERLMSDSLSVCRLP